MIENPVRAKLLSGGTALGVMAFEFFTPGLARVLKAGGAEFVILDTEHSGAGMDTLKSAIAYARGAGIVPMVRVPGLARRVLERFPGRPEFGPLLDFLGSDTGMRRALGRATGRPITPGPLRPRPSGISSSFRCCDVVARLNGGDDRLHGDAAAGHELAAGMAD